MRPGTSVLIMVTALAFVTFVSGCTTSPAPPAVPTVTPSTTTVPDSASVTIKNFAFDPSEVTIAKGGTVTWTNDDGTSHTVAFDDGNASTVLGNGKTFVRTFDAEGTFSYHCSIHPSMTGKVIVK